MKVLTVGTKELSGPIKEGDKISLLQLLILGLQHTFTMFGATVLVPLLTGLDVGVALLLRGLGLSGFTWLQKEKFPFF